ncbi:MAG: sulfurtransferase [Planctomycetaceae bacterium]
MPTATASDLQFVNIAAYRFVALEQPEQLRHALRPCVDRLNLRGTILLSPEGINLFLAARRHEIDEFLEVLQQIPEFAGLEVKESFSEHQPFNRMLIKVKQEIIAFGIEGVNPVERTSPKLPAKELKQWLDEGRKVHLLDTRNDYEIEVGTFHNAVPAGVDNFRDFPEAVRRLPESMKDEPIVMFCTGGIRCEKAGPFMEQEGFKNVYQLEGGILKYFEECGGAHYDGDCFVFDQRVAVNPALEETEYTQCYVCQEVVSPMDQRSRKYVAGISCPRCYREPVELLEDRLRRRNAQVQTFVTPLPGSQPYFNIRPLNVPERFHGLTLLDFLAAWHPQVDRDEWRRKIESGEIVPGQRYGRRKRRMKSAPESVPLSADRIVRAGERFEHLLPGTVEPDVNGDIQILFDDDQLIVINKPAPLPLHPSGRFHRNTVQYILQSVYKPELPLIAHRLDANTSGVLVLCRKRNVARVVQPQFEKRTVTKTYLARVIGHPLEDEFRCDAGIASSPGEGGLRFIDELAGDEASTVFRVQQRFADGTALLEVHPLTGRTNQIRVHLWHLGYPVQGDPAYLPDGRTGSNSTLSVSDPPMCLHAFQIALHDCNGERRQFTAPAPQWASSEKIAAV